MTHEARKKAARALAAITDGTVPPWLRLHKALAAYGGLNLTGLSTGDRSLLERTFVRVNQILSRNAVQEIRDYERLPETDVSEALSLVRGLSLANLGKAQRDLVQRQDDPLRKPPGTRRPEEP